MPVLHPEDPAAGAAEALDALCELLPTVRGGESAVS